MCPPSCRTARVVSFKHVGCKGFKRGVTDFKSLKISCIILSFFSPSMSLITHINCAAQSTSVKYYKKDVFLAVFKQHVFTMNNMSVQTTYKRIMMCLWIYWLLYFLCWNNISSLIEFKLTAATVLRSTNPQPLGKC